MPDVDLGASTLLLDFDGTLVDIAETPDGVLVDAGLPDLLARLSDATGGRIALVSGRAVADVGGFLPDFDGLIIGGHGAERREDGHVRRHPAADSPALPEIVEAAEGFAAGRDGLIVERKPTGIVVHYRRRPDAAEGVLAFVAGLAELHDGFELHEAKMAAELRPEGIGKDAAIADLMSEPRFAGTIPIFFGDDATDEPALVWVAEAGGVAVKVGEGESAAPLRLADPAAVRALLDHWTGGNREWPAG
ncbi:trehalose-phosphatase [Wenxinia marina]|uniref:Trehalose 6-phosphate phosphatase n=1 Tax=Wenxinia marina DSM 24838 TaxID=1123501 RepID=A0A0D0Q8Y8_9RHOB|nr:trehalose-phosphatase [Wenxinia marina]KIQ68837.1 trehalose 6-phosphatase [Wenxinia marina DSM 24838]